MKCHIGFKLLFGALFSAATAAAFVLPASSVSQSRPLAKFRLQQSPVQVQENTFWARSEASPAAVPEIVYILIYNAGTTEEAVHTSTLEDQGNAEVLWAFEDIDDCMQFATLVVENEPPPAFNMALSAEPIPTPVPMSQMVTASQDMGVILRLVPSAQ